MKEKLSAFAILVLCVSLFAGCGNSSKKGKETVNVPQDIQNIITEKYPKSTLLDFDKEKNGSEVEIDHKGTHKEVYFNTNNEWVKTKWDIRPEDVPVVVMDELSSSAYNQYKIDEVDVIENPSGTFYQFELSMDNNKVKLLFDSKGQLTVTTP